jgi:tetratricopeptide (TPR) repeat protein
MRPVTRTGLIVVAAALAATLTLGAQTKNLGRIDFPTSGSPEAQKHFIQGMLLLHSFEYADARDEFQAASKLEPHFAMAYWGEALTYTHPLWMQQDVMSARAALSRLAPTKEAQLAAAPTEREKDYIRAVEALYGDGDKLARDLAYAAALERMHAKYPNDLEAASLYALALMGTCQYQRDAAVYMRAAAVAEEVFAKNPEHPGAIHYLIHAYDDPIHAPLGLRVARVYGKVAGAASHAQHMPSHIFIAMGMWDDVISANIQAAKVADDRMKAKSLGPEARNYHALLWLEYAYLQQGPPLGVNGIGNSQPEQSYHFQPHIADAERVLADAEKSAFVQSTGASMSQMRAVYALATGSLAKVAEVSPGSGMLPAIEVLTSRGLIEVRQGHADAARKTLAEAQAKLSAGGGSPQQHAGMAMPGSPNDRKAAEIMVHELEAVLLQADGKRDAAFQMLSDAAAAEDAMTFEFGPPVPVKPVHELYGELLLAEGIRLTEGELRNEKQAETDLHEAQKQFQHALERCPKRWLSLVGVSRADQELGRLAGMRAGH